MELYQLLKKEFKEDLWNVINKEVLQDINFFNIVFEYFKHKDSVDLLLIGRFADNLKEKYQEILSLLYDYIQTMNGNVLKAMDEMYKEFELTIKPLTRSILIHANNGNKYKRVKERVGRN